MIATFCNNFVGNHIFIQKCRFKQTSKQIGREHFFSNNRDNNITAICSLVCSWLWIKIISGMAWRRADTAPLPESMLNECVSID